MICPSCQADNVARAERCYACGHALHRAAIGVGTVIASRFELLEELGRGGMGSVYRAHDRALDEVVALKILRPDLGGSAEVALRFRREIKLAWKVRHRNVCAIHEYWEADGLRFISMEFVQGVDLKRTLREQGRLFPREAFEVAVQIAKGLGAIHEAGVVHRDLKTMNIMRDRKGVVRLMDFGIAKSLEPEAGPGATQVGQIVGTPDYMSPEQIKGGPLDGRSDIYALGVVVFELFTGELPFRGDTPVATLMKHLHEPPPLDLHVEELPPALVPVLERMLAKEPGDRHATAEDVVDALREARQRTFPEAGTSPPGARETVPRPASLTPVPATAVTPQPRQAPPLVPAPTPVPVVAPPPRPTPSVPTPPPASTPSPPPGPGPLPPAPRRAEPPPAARPPAPVAAPAPRAAPTPVPGRPGDPPRRPPPPPPPPRARHPAPPAGAAAATPRLPPGGGPPPPATQRAAPTTSSSMAARPAPAPPSAGAPTPLSMAAQAGAAPERPTSASGSFELEFEPPAAPEAFDEEFPEREQPQDFEQEFDTARREVPEHVVIPKPGEVSRRPRQRGKREP